MVTMNRNKVVRIHGFSLIEVMIAIVVLSFGLLALAALQAGLFRAGAEAKARANATAIAQQQVETAKTFAYTSPPNGTYPVSQTYSGLATSALTSVTVNGVTYAGCRQVRRYRYNTATSRFVALNEVNYAAAVTSGALTVTCVDTAAVGAAFDPATPEFKEVRVDVAWVGDSGQVKTVEVTDSVAAISPADSVQVVKTPIASSRGPEVWIVPPNQNNPSVVPIAIGTNENDEDIAAASSNPKPERFVEDVSSVTLFSVQTFTGDTGEDAVEVRLNRKIDVAAASCVCSSTAQLSTTTNPAYLPTVWNGKRLAFMEPAAVVGKAIGLAASSSDPQIEALCTSCCRDHYDASAQSPKVDPYRSTHEHYGYTKQGQNYNVNDGLLPVGAQTNNEYVEACRLVRVNGRMRVAVDALQNHMAVTPLNSAGTGFQNASFVDRYSSFVSDYANYAAQNIPVGYPSPTAKLPAPTSAQLTTYADVADPAVIDFTAASQERKLIAFGLYIDYLSQDTIDAYNCAVADNNTGSCSGLGTRNPLEYIPFYAVNMGNLGAWGSSKTDVADVTDVGFSNQGFQTSDGGVVTSKAGNSNDPFPVSMAVKKSNSGLTNTAAIDTDDAAAANVVTDAQNFRKQGNVVVTPDYHYLYFTPRIVAAGINNIGNLLTISIGGSSCTKVNAQPYDYWRCQYDANAAVSLSISVRGFTTQQGNGQNATITDRQICLPAPITPTLSAVPAGDGATTENVQITLGSVGTSSWTIPFDTILDSDPCQGGLAVTAASP